MFNKTKCQKCKKSISKKFSFCPYCGNNLNNSEESEEDFGILGKNDLFTQMDNLQLPMGFNTIFNSLMKNLSKQMSELERETPQNSFENYKPKKNILKKGISISISTSGKMPPEIKINSFGDSPQIIQDNRTARNPIKESSSKKFSQEKIKKLLSLPREEPLTSIRRLSNKVTYEIAIPGVKSIEDISIDKLESSVEIKALGKDKSYFKIIPIDLPITKYNFSKDKLVLEFKAE